MSCVFEGVWLWVSTWVRNRSCCWFSSDISDDCRDETTWPSWRPVRSGITSVMEVMFSPMSVVWFVCLFAGLRQLDWILSDFVCRLTWRLGPRGSWWFPSGARRGLSCGWSRQDAPSTCCWIHRGRSGCVFTTFEWGNQIMGYKECCKMRGE